MKIDLHQFCCVFLAFFNIVHWGLAQTPDRSAPSFALFDFASAPSGYVFEQAIDTAFDFPMDLDFLGPESMLVCEKEGRVLHVAGRSAPSITTFFDVRDKTFIAPEMGLYSAAVHPRFPEDPRVFIAYCEIVDESIFYNQIVQVSVDVRGPVPTVIPNSERPIIRNPHPTTKAHVGIELAFGPDGYLYFGTGDGKTETQVLDRNFFSGVFRIDVDRRPTNLSPTPHAHSNTTLYRIPRDNPYIGRTTLHGTALNPATLRTEYFAIGFRNPWRLTFSPEGELYVADVGGDIFEEVNHVKPGRNYGWHAWEGRFQHHPWLDAALHTPPFYTYANGSGEFEGKSVGDLVFYEGSALPELQGNLIFCDYISGHVWAMDPESAVSETTNPVATNLLGLAQITNLQTDPLDGEVLALESKTGRIWKLGRPSTDQRDFHRRLSDTEFFTDLSTLDVGPGIVPYEVNVPFWSDGAHKRRWISLPDPEEASARITPSRKEPWRFPVGTVFCKHFDLQHASSTDRRPLETRFLVVTESGLQGATYRWEGPAYQDAVLVPATGLTEDLPPFGAQSQTWSYPSRSQCLQCHNAEAGGVLGVNTRQLNREIAWSGLATNQISALVAQGIITSDLGHPSSLPRLAGWADEAFSQCYRVRSYLQVNCAPCHHPSGVQSPWDARIDTALQASSIFDAPFRTIGFPDEQIVAPGSSGSSGLLGRLASTGPNAMPPIGHHTVDHEAVAQIRTWINGLDETETYEAWIADQLQGLPLDRTPFADPDGDHMDNRTEWILGLNPNDAGDRSKWQLFMERGQASLKFSRRAGFGYEIETSPNLAPDSWAPAIFPGATPHHFAEDCEFLLPIPTSEEHLYYRIRVIPP